MPSLDPPHPSSVAVAPAGEPQDETERVMSKYDLDNSGTFSKPEVKAIYMDLVAAKAKAGALLVFAVVLSVGSACVNA